MIVLNGDSFDTRGKKTYLLLEPDSSHLLDMTTIQEARLYINYPVNIFKFPFHTLRINVVSERWNYHLEIGIT